MSDDDYDDTRDAWDELLADTRLYKVPTEYKFGPGFTQSKLWITREGKSMLLEQMTPSHRGNTVRMLERKVEAMPGLTVEALHETPLIKRLKELGTE